MAATLSLPTFSGAPATFAPAQELLGHTDISTTRDSYATFDTEDLARVLRSMRDDEGNE